MFLWSSSQILHDCWKSIALTIQTFVGKVMSRLLNTLSRVVVTFLARSKLAAVTICSDFGAQENKICHCFHFSPFYLSWNDGTRCHGLRFWMLSFKPAFSFSSFTFSKWLFSTCSISTIWVLSSAFLRLLIFLPEILIPTCVSSSLDFTWCTLLLLLSHFSCVRLCATPQTAAHQAPPSLGFSRQER